MELLISLILIATIMIFFMNVSIKMFAFLSRTHIQKEINEEKAVIYTWLATNFSRYHISNIRKNAANEVTINYILEPIKTNAIKIINNTLVIDDQTFNSQYIEYKTIEVIIYKKDNENTYTSLRITGKTKFDDLIMHIYYFNRPIPLVEGIVEEVEI